MKLLWLVFNGMLIGISNIIPGVSGGTMAVSLGIYDDLIFSITHLMRNKKRSARFLLPLGVGIIVGVLFFSYAIEFLLSEFPFFTALIFVGLIIGGLPILNQEFKQSLRKKNEKVSLKHVLVFLFFVIFIIGFSLMQEPAMDSSSLVFSFSMVLIMFVLGVIASATMIIPGVSGSLVLMVLGYYYPLIQLLNLFFKNSLTFNWVGIFENLLLIFPFGIGVIVGVFVISKLLEFLFLNFPSITYSGILGLVIASPFSVLYNTDAFSSLSSENMGPTLLVGIALMALSFYITFYLGKLEDKITE